MTMFTPRRMPPANDMIYRATFSHVVWKAFAKISTHRPRSIGQETAVTPCYSVVHGVYIFRITVAAPLITGDLGELNDHRICI